MRRPRLIDAGFSVIVEEMRRMGVDPAGVDIMGEKGRHLLIRLDDVDLRAALILKQDMLSLGGEAALRREAASLKVSSTPVLLMGTALQLRRLAEKLPSQPFKLSELAGPLKELVEGLGTDARFLVGDRNLLEGGKKAVMGILNVTEDSFSDGGRYLSVDAAVSRGLAMLDEGADIIDVGGESTRPGAVPVSEDVEAERVVPVIRELAAEGRGVLSVDTTKSSVARKALEAGASIINDISGLAFDPFMGGVAAETGASLVLMHTRGRPETMQEDLEYGDLMGEICSHLERAMDKAMEAGTGRERICVDPGIGFGKSPEQNLEILARLGELRSLGAAVMVGASRKSFIGHFSGAPVQDRKPGSIAAAVAAVLRGADIVRVHDVAETVQALSVGAGIRRIASC